MGCALFWWYQSIALEKVTQGWWPRKILKVHESARLPRCNKFMLCTEHVLSALGFPLSFPFVWPLAKPESGSLRKMSNAISRDRGKFEKMFQNV